MCVYACACTHAYVRVKFSWGYGSKCTKVVHISWWCCMSGLWHTYKASPFLVGVMRSKRNSITQVHWKYFLSVMCVCMCHRCGWHHYWTHRQEIPPPHPTALISLFCFQICFALHHDVCCTVLCIGSQPTLLSCWLSFLTLEGGGVKHAYKKSSVSVMIEWSSSGSSFERNTFTIVLAYCNDSNGWAMNWSIFKATWLLMSLPSLTRKIQDHDLIHSQ